VESVNLLMEKLRNLLLFFDSAEKINPKLSTKLWQRGLSLYYAGKYSEAAKQFSDDVAQNPNDTEESIWNFLSLAQLYGTDAARKKMIRIQGERRPVMREVYTMFRDGNTKPIEKIATSNKATDADRFYAALYLGLYFEACGDAQASRDWIQLALVDSKSNTGYAKSRDYMYYLAKTHAKLRGFYQKDSVLLTYTSSKQIRRRIISIKPNLITIYIRKFCIKFCVCLSLTFFLLVYNNIFSILLLFVSPLYWWCLLLLLRSNQNSRTFFLLLLLR